MCLRAKRAQYGGVAVFFTKLSPPSPAPHAWIPSALQQKETAMAPGISSTILELWQSGWGYILPVWPCPGVSSDGATVSPDPSCLSLQYLCCRSLWVGGLGSVCYIWSISPVLSGILCEFKYALSNSLFLSFFLSFSLSEDLSRRTMPQDYLT